MLAISAAANLRGAQFEFFFAARPAASIGAVSSSRRSVIFRPAVARRVLSSGYRHGRCRRFNRRCASRVRGNGASLVGVAATTDIAAANDSGDSCFGK